MCVRSRAHRTTVGPMRERGGGMRREIYNIIWSNRYNWGIDERGLEGLVCDVCVFVVVLGSALRERERERNVIQLHPSITNIWAGDECGEHAQGPRMGGNPILQLGNVGLWIVSLWHHSQPYSCREGKVRFKSLYTPIFLDIKYNITIIYKYQIFYIIIILIVNN